MKQNAEKQALEETKSISVGASQIRSYVLDDARITDLCVPGLKARIRQAVLDGDWTSY
jgi:peptide chain release factor 2